MFMYMYMYNVPAVAWTLVYMYISCRFTCIYTTVYITCTNVRTCSLSRNDMKRKMLLVHLMNMMIDSINVPYNHYTYMYNHGDPSMVQRCTVYIHVVYIHVVYFVHPWYDLHCTCTMYMTSVTDEHNVEKTLSCSHNLWSVMLSEIVTAC